MIREEITKKIKKIISEELMVDISEVKEESRFVEDLNADSLDIVDLIMALEEEFKIQISDEQAEKIQTVAEAIDAIQKLIS